MNDISKLPYKELVELAKKAKIYRPNQRSREDLIEALTGEKDPPAPKKAKPGDYDAEIVIFELEDEARLMDFNGAVLKRMPLYGVLGRGRTPILQELRRFGVDKGLEVKPGVFNVI